MKKLFLITALFLYLQLSAQAPPSLDAFRSRLDEITSFTASVKLETDIDFIQMPVKTATMYYKRDEPVKVESDDFVLVPKRGVDLLLSEIFQYQFLAVPRGEVEKSGVVCAMMNIIPEDKRANYAIATLYLDESRNRLVEAQIQTRKEGAYTLNMYYETDKDILPSQVVVSFEVEKVKIPIRYLAREGEVDRDAYKADGVKTGKVILYLSDYDIAMRE